MTPARAVAALFACAALGTAPPAPARQAPEPDFPIVRSWILDTGTVAAPHAPPPTHSLRLDLVTIAGTVWAPERILDAARGVAGILAQCGIRVSTVRLRELDAPPRYRLFHTPVSRDLARRAAFDRPAVFFVDDTLQRPAFDAEAIGRGNSGSRPELADTVWVAAGTRDLAVVLAHELVHVLSDSGEHSDAPGNLMREETSPEGTRLTPEQCARAIAVGASNGLLGRASGAPAAPMR